MSRVDALMRRVQRIERARTAPRSPIEAVYGSMDAYAAEVQTGIDAGTYDPTDMPVILTCLQQWHQDGLWGAWQRQSVLEYGR